MKKTKFLLVAALLAAAGYTGFHFLKPAAASYVYMTQPVTRGSITATVSATGKVDAVETVDVGTQVSGTIEDIYVDYNSEVKKGQLLAILDLDVLQSKVNESMASLAVSQAGVAKAQADVTNAQRSHTRNQELWGRKLIARSELDSTETALLVARASLAEAKSRVLQSQESLRQAETNLGYAKIISPVDGVVVDRQVDVGQTVAASMTTPTLFLIARDLTKMQVEANIDEADIGRIREGQRVICTFDAWPDDTFDAKVVQKRLNPETVSNVVTYKVIVAIGNEEDKLMPGMTANISVITEERNDVLKVPAAALRFSPPSDVLESAPAERSGSSGLMPMPRRRSRSNGGASNVQTVWLVDDDKLAGSLEIDETGISDRTWVEVRGEAARELKEGQRLAVAFTKESSGTPGSAAAGAAK